MLYGALEAGGTKMVCAVGDENGTIFDQLSIPTLTPEETMPRVIQYFKGRQISALGIACFGPVDLDRSSETYGFITTTPKQHWKNYDIAGTMQRALQVPVGFDTDVNGSLLGEVSWGAARGLQNAVYLTIGTGVGGGVMVNGGLVHGMLHPEIGHMRLALHPEDHYAGHCPFHGCCLEGLASGPAIEDRWGRKAIELRDRPEVWDMEAFYIAQALTSLILCVSPEIIILGGGVMHQEQLFPMIRDYVKQMLNGYLQTSRLEDLSRYIVPAACHDDQGIMGCLKLAMLEEQREQ